MSLFLNHEMSHTSNEIGEDEDANLYNPRKDGGMKSSPIPQA